MNEKLWQDQVMIDDSALAEYAVIEAQQPGFLKQLVSLFAESTETQLSKLEAATQGEDLAAVKLHSHTIKGSALSLGAMQVMALAKHVEANGQDGKCPTLAELEQLWKLRDEALDSLKKRL